MCVCVCVCVCLCDTHIASVAMCVAKLVSYVIVSTQIQCVQACSILLSKDARHPKTRRHSVATAHKHALRSSCCRCAQCAAACRADASAAGMLQRQQCQCGGRTCRTRDKVEIRCDKYVSNVGHVGSCLGQQRQQQRKHLLSVALVVASQSTDRHAIASLERSGVDRCRLGEATIVNTFVLPCMVHIRCMLHCCGAQREWTALLMKIFCYRYRSQIAFQVLQVQKRLAYRTLPGASPPAIWRSSSVESFLLLFKSLCTTCSQLVLSRVLLESLVTIYGRDVG